MGIGTRLFLAFLAITAVSLSSGVAGWLILRQVSEAQSDLSSNALPAVAATRRAADAAAKLVAAAPALTAATDEPARAAHEAALASLVEEIDNAVSALAPATLDTDAAPRLKQTVDLLVHNLAVQNRLVKERLLIQRNFAGQAEETIGAATAIVDLSETLVSNASAGASAVIANLYSLVEDPARNTETYAALDRLIEQDIYLLDRMWELRLRSSQIALLTNRLTRAINREEVNEIAQGAADHLRVVRRRVASIDDPVRRAQASQFLQVLSGSISASPRGHSLFAAKTQLLEIGEELGRIAEDNTKLSAEVASVAQQMLGRSEAFARETASQASRAVGTGLWVLLISSGIAVVVSGLIVWLYVERGIVRRLGRLTGAMQRLTAGDLSTEVREESTPELRALSDAVRAFRDESGRRRTLEIEQERTNEDLRRHREELQILVGERTRQLEDANALLHQEVAQHALARDLAESSSRSKSEFLATMSHEIRTPMTGMLGMLRLLNDSDLPEVHRRQLAIAASSGEALLGILNNILDYSKIESGRTDVDLIAFDLRETLAGVVELMRPWATEKGLLLAFDYDPTLWSRHVADAAKLRQIFFNLISNAIKFTEHGTIRVSVRRGRATRSAQEIEIAVADSGIGISAGDQDSIFDAFTQSDPSITRRFGGTGLGLAISRRYAEILGGALTVRSTPGEGSTFTLALPLSRPKDGAKDPLRPRVTGNGLSPSLDILVVEDDEPTRLVAEAFLQRLGHRVRTVPDGYRAVTAVEQARPDLVFMDISLPGMDGPETAKRLRAVVGATSLPVVAMSAHVFKEDVDRSLACGLNGFLAKPLTPEALEAAIADASSTVRKPERQVDRNAFEADLKALGPDAMTRILDAATAVVPGRLSAARENLERHDLDAIALIAHATRSSAASMGFEALFRSTEKLEIAARRTDLEAVQMLLVDCEADYASAMAEARGIMAAHASVTQESVATNR
ncbi:MAG: response regulator [Rhizobiaceae bacterium]|nr:response regulator [Rhizobiaceae bacterium]